MNFSADILSPVVHDESDRIIGIYLVKVNHIIERTILCLVYTIAISVLLVLSYKKKGSIIIELLYTKQCDLILFCKCYKWIIANE